jgi:hypothetical protein
MKNNYTKIVSPEGVSQYAWLTQPDTKFDDSGHYKVNLIIPTDKASSLIKQIDEEMIKSMATAKDSNKGKTIKSANAPYDNELDDDGKPTGNTIFKFKRKAQIITKDGKVVPFKVALFDSKGVPLTDVNVWSGSKMKASAELVHWFTAMAGAGVSLRLRAVQITELVEGGSGSNAEGFGFDEVKDGYKAPEKTQQDDKSFENEVPAQTENKADF